jgi:RHS repeat-associated protein
VSQATYTYDPFGGLASSTGSITNPFRFAGQYQDPSATESGFYYLRARYYDPVTAQLISMDPLVAITRAPYSYANGSPLDLVDPTGLDFWNDVKNLAKRAAKATMGRFFRGRFHTCARNPEILCTVTCLATSTRVATRICTRTRQIHGVMVSQITDLGFRIDEICKTSV